MKFARPELLMLLWAVAVIVLLLWTGLRFKRSRVRRFADTELLKHIAASYDERRQKIKYGLIAAVFLFSVLSLARPQWGYRWQEVKRQGLDIFVAIDVSKSMLTSDVRPNRLARTKLGVQDLVKKLKGDRIGLIAFAGEAFLVCPLTVDYGGFLLSLDDLNINSIPRGGTAIQAALKEAVRGYEQTPNQYKAVIILTDGENLEGDPLAVARELKKKNVRVYTIGIGTQEGELIQIQNKKGDKEYLKDSQGNFVKSRLNEKLLQEIALLTGGVYVRASGGRFGLDVIYDQQLSKLEKRDIESRMGKKYFERFQLPLAAALLFLVMDSLVTTRKR